ncbi:MAG: TrkH family potassium uptake protein [Eubacteriales bacterium]|nr:TrkH family potassium uptake protein [Eubacteriales bacterium]
MNYGLVSQTIGKIMLITGTLFSLPVFVSFIYSDGCAMAFLLPMAIMLIAGFFMTRVKKEQKSLYIGEGFLIVTLTWILISIFSAMAFVLSGAIPSPIDALFESVSGFTTTGATILAEIESLPKSVLFWRSFTHWIGGMGVLVFILAITSNGESKNMYIMRAESPGPKAGKIVSKTKDTARILYLIYVGLTITETAFLLFGGMSLFDSVVTAFATAGTGGFSVRNASIAAYDSAYIDYVTGIFMLLFGINFTVYFLILTGKVRDAFKNEEVRWYLLIILISTLAITAIILNQIGNLADAIRQAFFTVSATITTTGFVLTDYGVWPTAAKIIIFLLMFIGACSGSTGGGIKVIRILILSKLAGRELKLAGSPRTVRSVSIDSKAVNSEIVRGVGAYFIVFMITFSISILLVSFDNLTITEAISGVATCINNVGPGFESIGPVGNFSEISMFSKAILIINMLLGRLELFPILALFSPSLWKV